MKNVKLITMLLKKEKDLYSGNHGQLEYIEQFNENNINADFLCDYVWEKGESLLSFEIID